MRRLRRLIWLLWLFAALLPVRGMAMGAYAPLSAGDAMPQAVATEQAPCPMHAASPGGDTTPASACTLCDVCHLVAMPLAPVCAGAEDRPQAEPRAPHGLGAGRAPADGLFRPPR